MVHNPPGNEFRWSIGPNVPFVRKIKLFTDEWHDLVTAIRKYGVFEDGSALPVRDTWFLAEKGVSRHGKASVLQNPLAIQTFGRKKVCRGMGKQLNRRKPVRDTGIFAEKGVSLQGKASVSQNPLAIQTFGRKMVCRGMGKQLNVRKPVRDWSMGTN